MVKGIISNWNLHLSDIFNKSYKVCVHKKGTNHMESSIYRDSDAHLKLTSIAIDKSLVANFEIRLPYIVLAFVVLSSLFYLRYTLNRGIPNEVNIPDTFSKNNTIIEHDIDDDTDVGSENESMEISFDDAIDLSMHATMRYMVGLPIIPTIRNRQTYYDSPTTVTKKNPASLLLWDTNSKKS